MNIHESDGGPIWGSSKFYDVHTRLAGPVVKDLAHVFCSSLAEAEQSVHRDPGRAPAPVGSMPVQILVSNVRRNERALQQVLIDVLTNAESQVLIASAYFLPPGFIRRALLRTRAEVQMVLSGGSDMLGNVDLLGQNHAVRRFLDEPNFRVHYFGGLGAGEQHMHAKLMVVDGYFTAIGSYNFDRLSARRNLELTFAVYDVGFASQMAALHSRLVQKAPLVSSEDPYFKNPLWRAVSAFVYTGVYLTSGYWVDGLDQNFNKWRARKAYVTHVLDRQVAETLCVSLAWGLS
jgi:cardiolipin synthase